MILHFDCDAFFASVAQALHPQWRGQPVVTGHERGIISAASYEAKAYGIRRGVALWEVKVMCPQCIVTDTDYYSCELYSQRAVAIIERTCPRVVRTSIDEGYADLSELPDQDWLNFIQHIQAEISRDLGIGVSFGVAATVTLAKAASKARKPRGTVVVAPEHREAFLATLALGDICGIGPAAARKLGECGCRHALDFVRLGCERSSELLGKHGEELWLELSGTRVFNPLAGGREVPLTCTSSRTVTPTAAPASLWAQAVRHLQHVCHDLRQQGLAATRWAVWLRRQPNLPLTKGEMSRRDRGGQWYHAARIEGQTTSVTEPTNLPWEVTAALYAAFCRCYRATAYRSVGVTASGIVPVAGGQLNLFRQAEEHARGEQLAEAVDTVNERFGHDAVLLAASLPASPRRRGQTLDGERREQRLAYPLLALRV